jgi:hypothetical protein
MDIPPEDSAFTGDAAMRIWKSETSFNGVIRGKTETEKADEAEKAGLPRPPVEDTTNKTVSFGDLFANPFYEPLRFTETLRFNNSFTASQNVVYEPEKDEFQSMTSSLSFYGLTASYTLNNSTTYRFETDHWAAGPVAFEPREFRLGYGHTFKKDELWNKRLSMSLGFNTALVFDLQRYTNSNLNFSLNFTLGISKFLDISLGTTSANAVLFRYFRDLPFFSGSDELPRVGEENLFKDLINSFRFDDEELRTSSGFKLKNFRLSLLHHLGDWNAKLDMALAPYLPTGAREFKFNTEISFVVQWLPISEIKSEITYNKDIFEFK